MHRLLFNLLVISAVCLAAVLTAASTATAKDWRSYTSEADFPAFVKSITFNYTIDDAGNCVTWGRWTVCMGSERPKAKLVQCQGGVCPNINMFPFECSNPAAGTFKCTINIIKDDYRGEEDCEIGIPLGQTIADYKHINIKCPTDLVLE